MVKSQLDNFRKFPVYIDDSMITELKMVFDKLHKKNPLRGKIYYFIKFYNSHFATLLEFERIVRNAEIET